MTVELDVTGDFPAIMDGLSAVSVELPDGSTFTAPQALGRAVARSEIEASNGQVLIGDRNWHLPIAEVPSEPRPGSVIVSGDERWTVLTVSRESFQSRWRCLARELSIAHNLDNIITIEQATYTKGQGGAAEPAWQAWQAALKAHIQIIGADNEATHERHTITQRARITVDRSIKFEEGAPPGRNYRIRDKGGQVWKVIGYEGSQRIDALPVITAELSPWPMS